MTYKYIPLEYKEFGDLYNVLFENKSPEDTFKVLSNISLNLLLEKYNSEQIKRLLEMLVDIKQKHILLQIKKENGGKWVIKNTKLNKEIIKGIKKLDDIILNRD